MGEQQLVKTSGNELTKPETHSLKYLDDSNSISVYRDELATKEDIDNALKLLSIAFKSADKEFLALLNWRMKDNNFTKQRCKDAIANVIDNFHYKELNVADVISFDKRLKLYTYDEVCSIAGCFPSPNFNLVVVNGARMYVKVADATRYGL